MAPTTSIGVQTKALAIYTTYFSSDTGEQRPFGAMPGPLQLDLIREALASMREYMAYAVRFDRLLSRQEPPPVNLVAARTTLVSGSSAAERLRSLNQYEQVLETSSETAPLETEGIGPRIRSVRTMRNLAIRDLAERSGVSAPMLSQIERGETTPTLAAVRRIAAGLDLNVGQLVGKVGPPGCDSRQWSSDLVLPDYRVIKVEMQSPLTIALHVSAAALTPATIWGLMYLARAICRLPPQISADRADELRRAEEARLGAAVARRQRQEIELQTEGVLTGVAHAYADELQRRFPSPEQMTIVSDDQNPSEVDLELMPEMRPPDSGC
jgi:transcriptional regulator with XRE-family HTH domain